MALNDITFQLGQGGKGRPLPGQDFISGMVFYCADGSLPAGLSTGNRVKQLFGISDAEAIGILDTHVGETKGTATITVTADGATGDTVTLTAAEPLGALVVLGTYVRAAGDTSTTLVAAGIVAAINAGTKTHGYSAANTAAVITLTARPGLGAFATTLSDSIVGTVALTLGAFSGGVGSVNDVWHYHISEYFRMQPQGNLWVGFYPVPGGAYSFSEVATLQNASRGTIRQFGLWLTKAFASGDATALDTQCKALVTAHKETIAWLAEDISAVEDISTLTDLSTLTANTVSVNISQDGAALGATLFAALGKSITNLGAALGAEALIKVSASIAQPISSLNISDGTENDVIAFANGVIVNDPNASDPTAMDNLLSTLNSCRYIFLRNFTGYAGSYFNDNHTAIAVSSDYAYRNDNRTIQKATRGVYAALIPILNSELDLNADGTMTNVQIEALITAADVPLKTMVTNTEISARAIIIDPTQNVTSTSQVVVQVQIVANGIARNILVPIGYKQSLS
jgi:hypothetical protein